MQDSSNFIHIYLTARTQPSPSYCEGLTRKIEGLQRALAEADADMAEKKRRAEEGSKECLKQFGGRIVDPDGSSDEDGTCRQADVVSIGCDGPSFPPSDDEDDSGDRSEAFSDYDDECAIAPADPNSTPPLPYHQSATWSVTDGAQETTLLAQSGTANPFTRAATRDSTRISPAKLDAPSENDIEQARMAAEERQSPENLPPHLRFRRNITDPNKIVHTKDTPPAPRRPPHDNGARASTDSASPTPGHHNTGARSASVSSDEGGSASPHTPSPFQKDLAFPPLGTPLDNASKTVGAGDIPGSDPARPSAQNNPMIGAGSVPTQEEIHVVNSVGIEIKTAKYAPPEGHSVPWVRNACRPVKIAQPPSGYLLRQMVPISFRDSALSAIERADAFNDRLRELEKMTGLSGRYPRGGGWFSPRDPNARRPEAGRHYHRSERGRTHRQSPDSAYPAQGRRNRHRRGDAPTPAARDSSSSSSASARPAGSEHGSAVRLFVRPPTPPPDVVSVRRAVLIEGIPEAVSLPYILRALGNTGCIEEIKMEENYQGHYATVVFVEEETASMFAARQSLLVRISRERSETLPITYPPAVDVLRTTAVACTKGLSRIVVVGPCPEEYYVNAYMEMMGDEAQMQSGLVEYIWVMVENMSDAWLKHTLDISLETRGKLIQATISFSSIKAALEVAEAARELESFRGVKVTFGQDPYVARRFLL